jgi:predicted Rossmann-fold nucleotide-binding protein
MTFTAEAFVCLPGGFGTYDEVFQVLCHIQTKKMPRVPVILVGSDFWGPIDEISKNVLDKQFHTIDPDDVKLYTVTDDEEQIMAIVKHAPIRDICKEIETENLLHAQKLSS